jgi:dihydrofolate synthase/folylpolyglutamate synthase
MVGMAPAPDSSQREAARTLDILQRLREVEESILARAPEHDLEPSLERISAVMELAGDPQRTYPVIHLTGTNGKTTTARVVESILREMGLTTGRFTSPHLHTMLERIAIGGHPIEAEKFLRAHAEVEPLIELVDAKSAEDGEPRMTYFEVLVAVAYAAFADAPVDVAIIEVGMGGSWDATNVADGVVSVITPIALDHQHFLGNTVGAIALEKSGIIKADGITVSAQQDDPAVLAILAERAEEVGAQLAVEGEQFGLEGAEVAVGGQALTVRGLAATYPDLFLPFHGTHMAQNATLAIAAVEAFLGGGEQELDLDVLRAGLAAATSPGRLEVVRRSPTVLVDAAHNPAGATALRDGLQQAFTFTKLVGVVAILKDKDASEMLEILEPVLDEVIVTRTTSPRAMRPHDLGELARGIFGEARVTVVDDLPDALDRAAGIADESGVGGGVLATGSVITAAEVRMLLGLTDG